MDTQLSILIVDDVGTVRSFLSQTLMHLGIDNVREASTAAQCLSACKEKEFNIIFLDIELPDGDGKEIISQINEISPEANVVMVSAHSTVENVKEATPLCTTIQNEFGVSVSTTEHLLGALCGEEIDNLLIEIDANELPIMDGSAKNFVKKIREICNSHKILLCFDEMQAGFYRTGEKFGYQHYGVTADIICCGKGIGSGLPLSAVLSTAEIMDLPSVGNMSSTHSANPLVCAAGLATLEFMEDNNIAEKSKTLGKKFHIRLNSLKEKFPKLISSIEGNGMIAAIIFKLDDVSLGSEIASKASWECFKKGVFVVHTGRESIKLGPPLTIPEEALMESLDVIDEVLVEISNEY